MADLRAFLPYLGNRVSGVPEPVALREIRNACIQFADESQLFSVVLGPVATVSGMYQYAFTLPDDTSIAMVLNAWAGVRALETVPTTDVMDPTAIVGDIGDELRPTGKIRALYLTGPDAVEVYPTPVAPYLDALSVRVALRPTRAATVVDDLLLEDWVEEVVSGAVFRLASQPAQPWSNPAIAADALALFTRGLQRARVRSTKGKVISNATIKQRPFA